MIMKEEKMEASIEKLLKELTLEEKISMIHGAGLFRTAAVERLGIPALFMSDGPMGVRAEFADDEWRNTGTTEDFVSYLPCNSAIASTWNRKLAKSAGQVLGEEARGRGKDIILAPGINIKRSPLCGRNFEYMSEDPRLIEELVVPLVEGIQENDVAACVKHFAANSQETQRLLVDTLVDERTLQEIYFPGFLAAVEKGNIFSLMGAYNRLNGEHCCTSKSLLNRVLREEWGFDGMVVSDWGGVHDTTLAAESALDIEMDVVYTFDKHHMADPLLEKIKSGELPESLVDEKIRNILRLMYRLHMIGEGKETRKSGTYDSHEHQKAVLDVARESVILLKNEDHLLPLPEGKEAGKIAVIGTNAAAIHSNGGGSAEIKALYEISPLLGIKKLLGGNAKVTYAPGYFVPGKEGKSEINWQADSTRHIEEEKAKERAAEGALSPEEKEAKRIAREEELRRQYFDEAVRLAKESDTVIFVGGLNHDYDVEGKDREDITLPYGQDELIAALLAANQDTVICLYAGAPVAMPWKEQAKAIVWSYYAGMEGGTALAETLFGRVNPSGKLAETFIKKSADCPAHTIGTFGRKDVVEYKEGVMVGYRYYDTKDTEVSFCFGHGLSYTTFEYNGLSAEVLEDGDVQVTVTVKNTGTRAGKEIVQIYVAPLDKSPFERPSHELKAFEKTKLAPGEEKTLAFLLTAKDFTCYDEKEKGFVLQHGRYEIQAAASSRDVRGTVIITQ